MKIGSCEIDIIVQGYPGKAQYHGGLGWSTVALIRSPGRTTLVDTGSFGMRRLLVERLAKYGLRPADVTDVLLTHAHHDHCVNWTLFRHARLVIGAHELETALKEPWGETPTPELYVRGLQDWPTLCTVADKEEVFPGMTAYIAPGHTRGHLIFLLNAPDREVIFTGDAAKNRAELVSRQTDMTYDAAISATSINKIWELWRRRPDTVLVPGHDLPMTQEDGNCRYLDKREAGIAAWFGEDMKTTTSFQLTPS